MLTDATSADTTSADAVSGVDPANVQALLARAPIRTQTPTETNDASDDLDRASPFPRLTTQPSPVPSPSLTLGPQYRIYLTNAASFLAGISGGPLWEKLLERYLLFESLSATGGVSSTCWT